MIVKTTRIFLAILCATATSTDADQWSGNLEDSINQSLRPLQNLGARIDAQVRENLKSLQNLGPSIQQQVQQNLKPLQNLDSSIQQQVYQGLKPVREMHSKMRIRFGQNGRTIATFKDRQYLIQNGVLYQCNGILSEADGSCSGTLQKVTFDKKEDFCYANINSIINNWYCLGTGSGISSGSINGEVYCKSFDNSPTLLISSSEYKNLCGDKNNPIHYKYFTDVPIGEHGPDVQCSGNHPIVCTMSDSQSVGSYSYSNHNSYIHVGK